MYSGRLILFSIQAAAVTTLNTEPTGYCENALLTKGEFSSFNEDDKSILSYTGVEAQPKISPLILSITTPATFLMLVLIREFSKML